MLCRLQGGRPCPCTRQQEWHRALTVPAGDACAPEVSNGAPTSQMASYASVCGTQLLTFAHTQAGPAAAKTLTDPWSLAGLWERGCQWPGGGARDLPPLFACVSWVGLPGYCSASHRCALACVHTHPCRCTYVGAEWRARKYMVSWRKQDTHPRLPGGLGCPLLPAGLGCPLLASPCRLGEESWPCPVAPWGAPEQMDRKAGFQGQRGRSPGRLAACSLSVPSLWSLTWPSTGVGQMLDRAVTWCPSWHACVHGTRPLGAQLWQSCGPTLTGWPELLRKQRRLAGTGPSS